ncbi:hypothetical protein HH310_39775 [Actinoplanes sp. TBRC 11911]|uniref:hypothetical protein n=1 Tax=Actinoplanes sp. TBRC 11911 TaxID=2729386 RepID=UPI00145FC279|nr:hypothetical protein [Actinoplanes sp. TBRC 11911]NMO57300.1 hypothetical protein [Actinoplanes sp. TBRC 11911]
MLLNVILLYLVNGRPGWSALPFLTTDTVHVLTILNVSLAAGAVVNFIYLIHDPPWLIAAGGIVTTGLGIGVLARLWQVFPFDFTDGWSVAARVLLVLGIIGSGIGIVVQTVTLIAAVARRDRTKVSAG